MTAFIALAARPDKGNNHDENRYGNHPIFERPSFLFGVLSAVGNRANSEQLLRCIAVCACFIDIQCSQTDSGIIVAVTESGEHIVMHDLRALGVRQYPFDARTGHDTKVMAVQHKEDKHTRVLTFAADTPALE